MVAGRAGGAGRGGGGGGFEFNTYLFTAGPAQVYTFQPFPLHCNKKFIHAAGGHHGSTHPNLYISTLFITLQQKVHSRRWRSPRVKTKYTAIPHTPPLARVDVHGVIHAHLCCIRIPVFLHNYFCMNGGGGKLMKCVRANTLCLLR